MPTVFSRIIDGELPAHFVWKDDKCVAFLSINPLAPGHVLVVPRAELDHWIDLDAVLLAHLSNVSRTIGRALQEVFDPKKVGLMLAGLEIPHVHYHVVPINGVHDLDFANADPNPRAEDLVAAATKIRAALREGGAEHVSD
jgi:histidine triad (HIT) family protein